MHSAEKHLANAPEAPERTPWLGRVPRPGDDHATRLKVVQGNAPLLQHLESKAADGEGQSAKETGFQRKLRLSGAFRRRSPKCMIAKPADWILESLTLHVGLVLQKCY